MNWFGLIVDSELVAVIPWRSRGEPTAFDFHWPYLSGLSYEVVRVRVEVEGGVP